MSSGKCKLKQETTTYLLEWPKSRTLTTLNTGKYVEPQELSFTAGTVTLENSFSISYKTKFPFLTYHSAITPLGIYPKELKTYVHTTSFKQMFVTALFIIAKFWKQQRCPSVGEKIN